ncbi:hypothetical protein B7Z28_00240 [Candidatus Saccharibacteria bacterium 32-45-3]|nr:MAG: hypothetical protein B7Z28_00240 [Candidatus Saccharibacteria bacterium 32-45-3]
MTLELTRDLLQYMFDHTLTKIFITILLAILAQFLVRLTVNRAVRGIVHTTKSSDALDAKKRQDTLSKMFRTMFAIAIWIVAILVILWQLDINIGALATGAGLLGIIIGFGAQNSIKDILAGIFIIAENQYRIGDIVSLYANGKDISGVVEDISIRITRLRDLDGNTHIIPNGSINVTTNLSFHFANVNIDINVAYDTDIDHAENVINSIGTELSGDETWKAHIFEPIQFLRVDGFDESSVRLKAIGKVEPAQQWAVAGEFRRRLKKAFENEKIEIPLAQIVVHTRTAK